MPDLFIFLLKVNAALLLFCAGYYLVLRHLTFYTLNRIYLITAIVFATVYPKINLSSFAERHQQITKPVQAVILNWQAPAEALAKPDYWRWIELLFWSGVVLLALRLAVQLYSLYKLYRNSTAAQIHSHEVRIMSGNSGPFSFWKSIYINPANHEPGDLRSILQHEQIHVSEWHTVDVLLAELSTIFYWFNPGVWLMKKAVRENIEFITDRKILKTGTDSKQYQYSLVNVSFSAAPQGIVNHFNISTIKKRIIMMNAKRSSKVTLTRYAFLVPAVIALLLVFSISKAALVKKAVHNVKTFSLLINKMGDNKVAVTKTTKTNQNIPGVAKKGVMPQKTVIKTADTIKKWKIFIGPSNGIDSVNVVINGVKSSKVDLTKLSPNDIEAINVVSAGVAANDVIGKLDSKQGTIFVTTKNSGAKLRGMLNNVHSVNGTGNSSNSLNTVVVVGHPSNNANSDSDRNAPITVEGFSSSSTPATVVTVQGKNISGNGIRVYNRLHKDTMINGVATYSISGDTSGWLKLNSKTYTSLPNKYRVQSNLTFAPSPAHFSVDHIADKMIIINGKISTQADLKKISAFDIDKMVLKTDEETKELYGDKAKNGVVFIVTKKGK